MEPFLITVDETLWGFLENKNVQMIDYLYLGYCRKQIGITNTFLISNPNNLKSFRILIGSSFKKILEQESYEVGLSVSMYAGELLGLAFEWELYLR